MIYGNCLLRDDAIDMPSLSSKLTCALTQSGDRSSWRGWIPWSISRSISKWRWQTDPWINRSHLEKNLKRIELPSFDPPKNWWLTIKWSSGLTRFDLWPRPEWNSCHQLVSKASPLLLLLFFFFMVPSSCYLLNILGTFSKNRLNIWRKICWPRQWCVNNRLGIVINRCVVCYLLNWFTMLWIDCGGELAFFGNDRPQSSKAAGHCCCIFSSGGGGKLPIGPFFMAVIVSLSHVANGRHGRQVSSGKRGLHSESSSVEHLQYSSSSSSTCSADEQKMR